ncbi:unnamed protein product [Mytilus coruscus]|uniref:G-protein coupled receptors family 1 profile domain-containing protein n=1 Tax=Mytilus coruscus TaxID=42192 RepID=A0A6J8CWZ0_MYTCO|nr:unnamed protein product [Mytilus coruscus]
MNETVSNESDRSKVGVQTDKILLNRGDQWVYLAVGLVTLVIAVGCAGNVMVLIAVRKVKKLQTVSNIFVLNLSVCDLLIVVCVLPFNIYTYIADGWFIATSLCKSIGFLGYTLSGTTIITITLIAFNRYKLVLDPGGYKTLYTNRNITLMLGVACLEMPISEYVVGRNDQKRNSNQRHLIAYDLRYSYLETNKTCLTDFK